MGAQEPNPFEKLIPWHILNEHLEDKISEARAKSDTLDGVELYRAQGRILQLKEMLNLPGTLWVKYQPGKE